MVMRVEYRLKVFEKASNNQLAIPIPLELAININLDYPLDESCSPATFASSIRDFLLIVHQTLVDQNSTKWVKQWNLIL